jgi:hypothetical protein
MYRNSLLFAMALVFAPGCQGVAETPTDDADRGAAAAEKHGDGECEHHKGDGKGPCDCKHKDGEECQHKDGDCPHKDCEHKDCEHKDCEHKDGDCPHKDGEECQHKGDGKGPCDCKGCVDKDGDGLCDQHAKGDGKVPCECAGKAFVDKDGDGECDHHAKPTEEAK